MHCVVGGAHAEGGSVSLQYAVGGAHTGGGSVILECVVGGADLTACKAWVELTTARISRAVRIYGNDCTRH